MSEADWDVYVNEGSLVEVHRGQHMTVCQAHGEDWTAQPVVNIHSAAIAPATVRPAAAPRIIKPQPAPGPDRGFWTVAAIALVLAAWFAIAVSR